MIGIDINDRAIKIVELKEGPKGVSVVTAFIQEGVPSSKAIQKIFHNLNISDKNVYLAISGKQVVVCPKIFPFMSEKELRDALCWEAKELVSYPLEKAVVSYRKLSERLDAGVKKLEILLVVVEKDALLRAQSLVEDAGLKVKGISVVPFAIWDLMKVRLKTDKQESLAVLDIGSVSATFNAFDNGDLKFVREISIAGEAFTQVLMAAPLNFSREKAEELKSSQGYPDSGEMHDALTPIMEKLSHEILQTIGYISEKGIVPKISRLLLVGGASRLKNLDQFLTHNLGIEVLSVDPFAGMEISESIKAQNLSAHLAVATGMALGKAQSLNLIQSLKKKNDLINLPVKQITRIALAAGLAVLIVIGLQYYVSTIKSKLKDELRLKTLEIASRKQPQAPVIEKGKGVDITLRHLRQLLPASFTLEELVYDKKGNIFSFVGLLKKQENVADLIISLQSSDKFKKVKMGEVRKKGEAIEVQIELEAK